MSSRRFIAVLTVAMLAPFFSGCDSKTASVGGLVTLDDEPLAGGETSSGARVSGNVVFQSVGGGAKAMGKIDENGNYRLSTGSNYKIQPGTFVVSVTASELTPSDDGTVPKARRLVPKRYASTKTSGLEYSVEPGSNKIDIELSTK